jgi:PadR family transcriptional regulator PadR
MSIDAWTEQLRRGALEFADLVITEGTIYPLLARLTRDGLLQAEWSETESSHPRKYYRLTARGRRRLDQMREEWQDFASKISRLVEAAGAPR